MLRRPTAPSAHERVLKLADGRLLGYAEFGDPAGRPVFYFHGWPGSRLEGRIWHDAGAAQGVRIIALDRPGMGLSDDQPGRTPGDWPADVAQAANLLEVERFAAIGYSGGGPYALACGWRLGGRVSRIALLSSIGEMGSAGLTAGMSRQNRLIFGLARRMPWAMGLPLGAMALLLRHSPGRAAKQLEGGFSVPDRPLLASGPLKAMVLASAREAFRHGTKGPADDGVVLARPWGFALEQVETEVLLWQGDSDTNVPPLMGHYLADHLPHCRATFVPAAGHLWGPANAAVVLGALLRQE